MSPQTLIDHSILCGQEWVKIEKLNNKSGRGSNLLRFEPIVYHVHICSMTEAQAAHATIQQAGRTFMLGRRPMHSSIFGIWLLDR